MPAIAGGDKTPEEIAAEEEAARIAEEERVATEAAEAEAKRREELDPNDPDHPDFKGEFDKERAERLVANERARAKKRLEKAQADAKAAQDKARELERAQETEQETTKRERDEAKAEAERLRSNTERATIDIAIRDAAADAEVPAKTIKRLVRLVDRDDISVDEAGEVDGATEAVEAFLEEFPEFKAAAKVDPNEPKPELPGGAPDRKRKADKEMTPEQVQKLAKDNPEKFNELFDAGKIPQSALAGIK